MIALYIKSLRCSPRYRLWCFLMPKWYHQMPQWVVGPPDAPVAPPDALVGDGATRCHRPYNRDENKKGIA